MKKFLTIAITGMMAIMGMTSCEEEHLDKKLSSWGYIQSLKNGGDYRPDGKKPHFTYDVDEKRAEEIVEYFRLDTIVDEKLSTWENAKRIGQFVTKNIPHKNQKKEIKSRDAISLWDFHMNVESGFNCRMHSIMMHELLLACGIKNRFVTCMPYVDDNECHVVNIVWLPEKNKWAMIDTDMNEYVTDENDEVMSIAEMREHIKDGRFYHINKLEESLPLDVKYQRWYWSKNSFWFSCHEKAGFAIESKKSEDDRYLHLVPEGYWPYYVGSNDIVTHDDRTFWARPE